MAALIKHVLSNSGENILKLSIIKCSKDQTRNYGIKRHYKQKVYKVEMPAHRELKSTEDSIAARGFLRCQKDYTPPTDTEARIKKLFQEFVGSIDKSVALSDNPDKRFQLFGQCFKEFNHSIPNSILHTINSYDEVLKYYLTPVNTTLPLDRFRSADLPPNLHIQYEPLRFHPDEDMKFDGQTAFPKSNTLVTGLRTRKKYKGLKVVEGWPVD